MADEGKSSTRRYVRAVGPFNGYHLGLRKTPVLVFNLNVGGAFVNFSEEQPAATTFVLTIELPQDDRITVLSQTVYRDLSGIGVRFIDLDDDDRKRVERAVERARQQQAVRSQSMQPLDAAIAVDTSEAPAFLRVMMSGTWPTIQQQREVRMRLLASAQLTPATRVLVDLRDVENVPDYAEVNAVLEAFANDAGLPRVRAYVVASAAQHGLASQFKVGFGRAAETGIFTNEHEALEWLWNLDRRA